jgi:O-antigen/teichoic acid export membrane protein
LEMSSPSEVSDRFASTTQLRGELRARSLRAFAYTAASGAGDFAIRLISTAVLARLISPEEFGLFMMVVAVTAIADQFRDLGLSTATIQRERISQGEVSNLFWINVAAGSVLAVAVCALAPLIAAFFREERLIAITLALSATFVLGGMVVQHEALLARQMRHGQKSLVRVTASLLSTVLAVILALAGLGYWSLVWREISRSALIVVGVGWVCPWVPGRPDWRTDVRGLVRFGQELTLAYFLGVVSASIDRFLLGRSFGPGPVALYRQPYQLVVSPMSQFMSPLYQVALPALSVLQNEPARFRRFFHRVAATTAMVSMPLNIFLAVHSQELTALILGPKWAGAATFFLIFALSGILRSVVSTTGFVLVSRGESRPLLGMCVVNTIVAIALMGLGLAWGPVGVALGEGASVVVMAWPWMYVSFRSSPVTLGSFLLALSRPAASSALMGGALLLFRWLFPIASLSLSVAAGSLVSVTVLTTVWLLLPGGRAEAKELTIDILSSARLRATAGATS